jgi:signal recognition particle subunit SRP54
MFESLSEKFQSAFATLRGRGRIGEGEISVVCDEIRNALIDSDVARTVADKFVERIQLEASANLDSIKLDCSARARQNSRRSRSPFKIC